jgi:Ca2+-binding RTX toxin-like protein
VRVDTDDIPGSIPADDGRPGIDLDSLGDDVEIIEGSNFDDPQLFGSDANNVLRGLDGNDVIGGGEGSDSIDEGPAPNGADFINGGNGATDAVNYASRQTGGVNVSLDGLRNDGAVGEQDDVRPSVEQVIGTSFRDVLSGNGLANTLVGVSGNDTIDGSRGDDTLFAGPASDGITAGAGNDVIFARNGSIDNVDCGDNTDTDALERDTSENRVEGCERVEVGVLRLAPQGIRAEAGETAQLRLSWRHPQNWRKLRKVELRLTRDRVPVGEITIRPRAERISDRGDVELVRKRTGLTHKGKTVTARLAIRLDASLADQELTADVEATDTRGRRQLERDAGTVRVAE